MGVIIGLTGSKGIGKTQTCAQFAAQMSDQNVEVKGFYSPPVFENGLKTAIDVVALPTFERRRLGVLGEVEGFIQVRIWSMDPNTFNWINRMLKRFAKSEVLILDEFGPLEVEQGEGWSKALDLLKDGSFDLAVTTFRPDYQDFFRQSFPEIQILNLDELESRQQFFVKANQTLHHSGVLRS